MAALVGVFFLIISLQEREENAVIPTQIAFLVNVR